MRRSTILFVLLAFCAAALFVTLGLWQLDRRIQRRARNAIITARIRTAPVALANLGGDTSTTHYRRVRVSGQPDFDRDLALTFRGNMGSPGVDILTPVRSSGNDSAVLVNRGWIYSPDGMTADLSRWRESDTTFAGYVEEFETGSRSDSVRRNGIRRMDYAAIARVLPYPIRKFYIVATTDSAPTNTTGVVRLKPPVLDDGPHLSYAIQWFAFATIAVVGAGIIAARSLPRWRSSGQAACTPQARLDNRGNT
jgi:surfeit locus 1 family protein